MEKYRLTLIHSARNQLKYWFDHSDQISNIELHRFLHSIKGTAGTIGLNDIYKIVEHLMEQINENDAKQWDIMELKTFLFELSSLCYQADYLDVIDQQKEAHFTEENVPTILVVDDEISILMYIKEELEKQGWHVIATTDPERAITFFYDYNPDLLIIDVHLNQKSGFGVLNILNHKLTQQFIPQMMISVENSQTIRLKSYELGADDFIHKPFDINEFIIRVRRLLQRKTSIDKHMLVDELSQVYNRKYFNTCFERLFIDLSRNNEQFCLAIFDLDHFKKVNDQFGHFVGDEVLRNFAQFIDTQSRCTDTVFRFGGEEFLMLLPKTETEKAKTMINRLVQQFSIQEFASNGELFHVTFSSGLAEVNDPNVPIDFWMKAVDHALYEAKEAGRNQLKIWDQQSFETPKKLINVAVIDDDPIIITIVKDVFNKISKENHLIINVDSFNDGITFFNSDWIQSHEVGFVVLDGMIPEMDGTEVLEKIRLLDVNDRFIVLMLTARKSEEDIALALRLGADDYMTKPFNVSILEARIRRLIRKLK